VARRCREPRGPTAPRGSPCLPGRLRWRLRREGVRLGCEPPARLATPFQPAFVAWTARASRALLGLRVGGVVGRGSPADEGWSSSPRPCGAGRWSSSASIPLRRPLRLLRRNRRRPPTPEHRRHTTDSSSPGSSTHPTWDNRTRPQRRWGGALLISGFGVRVPGGSPTPAIPQTRASVERAQRLVAS
jgi:hypothetical protein